MIARCPKNPEHKRFLTVAHVTEDWLVDEHGDFIEVAPWSESQVVHEPHPDNIWTCHVCGAQAEVSRT
jgi:hypothetical protein